MALYSELPVYKDTYHLLLKLVSMSVAWQRDYRYTLGQELKMELMDLLVLIYSANSMRSKSSVLTESRKRMERIKIYVRLLRDLQQIGTDRDKANTPYAGQMFHNRGPYTAGDICR